MNLISFLDFAIVSKHQLDIIKLSVIAFLIFIVYHNRLDYVNFHLLRVKVLSAIYF